MSFLNAIVDFVGGGVGDAVGGIIDELHTSGEEKEEAKRKMKELLIAEQQQMVDALTVELQAKERVLVAELQQGDNYTKRARPSIIYAGLSFIFLNYVLFPLIQPNTQLALPSEFWMAWGGVCATYSIGRTFEKKGSSNKAVSIITGSKLLGD